MGLRTALWGSQSVQILARWTARSWQDAPRPRGLSRADGYYDVFRGVGGMNAGQLIPPEIQSR